MSAYNEYLLRSIKSHMNENEIQEMTLNYKTEPLECALFFNEARENPKLKEETTARLQQIASENKIENVKITIDANGTLKLFSSNANEIDDELRKLKILELAGIDARIVSSQGFFNRIMNSESAVIYTNTPPSKEEEMLRLEKQAIIKSTSNLEDKEELNKIENTFGTLDHIMNGHSLRVAKNVEIGKDRDGNKYIKKDDVLIKYAESPKTLPIASESPKPTVNLDDISAKLSGLDELKNAFAIFAVKASSYGQGSYDTSDKDFEYGRSSSNGALTFVTNLKPENSDSKKYQFFFNGDTISVVEKIEITQGHNIFKPIEDDREKNSLIALATQKVNSKNASSHRGDNVESDAFVPTAATSISTNKNQVGFGK